MGEVETYEEGVGCCKWKGVVMMTDGREKQVEGKSVEESEEGRRLAWT